MRKELYDSFSVLYVLAKDSKYSMGPRGPLYPYFGLSWQDICVWKASARRKSIVEEARKERDRIVAEALMDPPADLRGTTDG